MTEEILRLVPLSMSLRLASDNFKFSEKAHKTKDIVKQGMKNIIGINLIGSVAKFIDF